MESPLNESNNERLDALKRTADKVGKLFTTRATRFKRASLFVKIAFVAVASGIAAIAQFVQFPPEGPTAWQVVGIFASLVVSIGSIFVIWTEQDGPEELAAAREAVEVARDAVAGYDEFFAIFAENQRLVYLVNAFYLMRTTLESAAGKSLADDKLADLVLEACDRSLPIAMGFQQTDQWTLGIYKVELTPDGSRELVCVATKRAIQCELSEARRWREGTGIAGVAFTARDEMVIPDLQAEGVRSIFGAAASEVREYDQQRYRSMVAVPIKVGNDEIPWGVVAATTDQVGHFSISQGNGLSHVEGARALAHMAALAIAMNRLSAS